MRTIFIQFLIIVLFCCTTTAFGFSSSIDSPYWVKVVSIAEKELPGSRVAIYFQSTVETLQGIVESVSHADLKIKTSNGVFIVPMTSIKFIEVLSEPTKIKK